MESCDFSMIPCPNKCIKRIKESPYCQYENVKVKRKDIDSHIKEVCRYRSYCCYKCGEEDTFENITECHVKICPNETIHCTNGECAATFMRKDEREHRKICDYEVVHCQYDSFNCPVKKMRMEIPQHIESDSKNHISLAQVKIKQLKKIITELKEEASKLEDEYNNVLIQDYHLTFRITELENKIRKNLKFESNPFYIFNRDGLKVLISVDFSSDGNVYARVEKVRHSNFPQTDFSLSLQLLNQAENVHSNYVAHLHIEASPTKLIAYDTLEKNPNYMLHNSIYLKVTIVLPQNWLACTF